MYNGNMIHRTRYERNSRNILRRNTRSLYMRLQIESPAPERIDPKHSKLVLGGVVLNDRGDLNNFTFLIHFLCLKKTTLSIS